MGRRRLALSTLIVAVCGFIGASESRSRDAAYIYNDIFMVDVDSSRQRNLTKSNTGEDGHPAISPDGRTLAFSRHRIEGGYSRASLAVMPARGGRASELIRITNGDAREPAWSRDGQYLAFMGFPRKVGVARRDGSGLTWIPEASHPTWLAGGRIAFLTASEEAIEMANADGSERVVLARASDLGVVKFLPPTAAGRGDGRVLGLLHQNSIWLRSRCSTYPLAALRRGCRPWHTTENDRAERTGSDVVAERT